MPIFQLTDDPYLFPNPELAPDSGLLAVGGDLSAERLISAYNLSYFPWYNPGEEILWWTPNPRLVLYPEDLKIHKSMRPYFNQKKFEVTFNQDFLSIVLGCKTNKRGEKHGDGTWITTDITQAYLKLHELGWAHSVEVWQDAEIVGGLYGLAIGDIFFGESMFAKVSNASKFGFITMVQKLQSLGFALIDCQQETGHLKSLGAKPILRKEFLKILDGNEFQKTIIK